MVKKIVKDPLFLAQKSVDATEADKQVVTDDIPGFPVFIAPLNDCGCQNTRLVI